MLYLSAGTKIRAFTLTDCLGKGGMSAVWKAHHAETGHDYALKILHGSVVDDEDARVRFFEEGLIQSRVSHPNVVTIKGRIDEHPVYALVMEYVDGPVLSEYIAERPEGLSLPESKAIATGILSGLNAAHRRGIVHRDVKPSNVLLARDFYTITPKLTDFGIAKVKYGRLNTVTSNPMGTPHFMSPEQLRDSKRVTSQTDIYSFGVTLYHIVTGAYPFDGDDLNALSLKIVQGGHQPPSYHRDDLPPELDELIERCMAPRAADRPADCRELLESILAIDWNQPHAPSRRSAGRRPKAVPRAPKGDSREGRAVARPPTPPPIPAAVRSRSGPVQRPPVPRPSAPVPAAESGEWRMSGDVGHDSFEDEDLTIHFRRRSWPMWVALVLIVAAAAAGTLWFLESQQGPEAEALISGTQLEGGEEGTPTTPEAEPAARQPMGTGSEATTPAAAAAEGSGLDIVARAEGTGATNGAAGLQAGALAAAPEATTASDTPSALQPGPGPAEASASAAAELRMAMAAQAETAVTTPTVAALTVEDDEPETADEQTADEQPAGEQPAGDDEPGGSQGESASLDEPAAAAEAPAPERDDGDGDGDDGDEARDDRRSRSGGDGLVGREAERAAEEAWRARQGRSAPSDPVLAPTIRAAGPSDDPLGVGDTVSTPSNDSAPPAPEPPGGEQLTPIQINRTIASRRAEFRGCFGDLDSPPIEMRVRITPEGRVSFARAIDSQVNGQIVACLVRELGRLQFEAFDGEAMNVRRTFGRVGPM